LSVRLWSDAAGRLSRSGGGAEGQHRLKNKSPDSRDDFNWKYVKGAATTPADLGER